MTLPVSDDAALWSALRAEAGVWAPGGVLPPPRRAPRLKKAPRVGRPLPSPEQGPRLRYPWENAAFNPGARDLSHRVARGRRLTGLILGLTLFELDGRRWVYLLNPLAWWGVSPWLTYPLPLSWGEDPAAAGRAFEAAWRAEAQRIAQGMGSELPSDSITLPSLTQPEE